MDERTNFILGLVASLLNLFGWITAIMSEESKKQFWVGIALLIASMVILAGMVVAEVW